MTNDVPDLMLKLIAAPVHLRMLQKTGVALYTWQNGTATGAPSSPPPRQGNWELTKKEPEKNKGHGKNPHPAPAR